MKPGIEGAKNCAKMKTKITARKCARLHWLVSNQGKRIGLILPAVARQ
jgi:hypothetical protein